MSAIVQQGRSRVALSGRRALIALELVVALNAIGGGIYGLAGAKDVPQEWLQGSPFHSYLLPSLVVLVAVGGSNGSVVSAAASSLSPFKARASLRVAGFGIGTVGPRLFGAG